MQGDTLTLTAEASDADFLDAVRTRMAARSIASEETLLPLRAVERLLALAREGCTRQNATPCIGYVRNAGIDDSTGEYCALVMFEDQDAARRVGALLFHNVTIEPHHETPKAANEEPRREHF